MKNNLDAYRGTYPDAHAAAVRLHVLANIASVDVVDPLTVTVTMKQPWVAFDAYLYGSGRVGMMAQAQLDDTQTCADNLIGTGPVQARRLGAQPEASTAEKNPDYWATDAEGEQLPYLDEIEFRPIVEVDAARSTRCESGEINAMHTSDAETIADLRDHADSGEVNALRVGRVRRGQLHHAQRVEAAVRQHQGPPGAGLRRRLRRGQHASSTTASPPRRPARSPPATSATSTTPASRPYDLDEAKELVQEYEDRDRPAAVVHLHHDPGGGDDRRRLSSSRSRPRRSA